MATATARRTRDEYRLRGTYGSLAYAEPAIQPGGGEVLQPRPKVRPRERAVVRPKIQVREAGRVSLFAVVGFLAVGVFAALLLMSYVQLTVAADSASSLRNELSALEAEEAKLLAQYELTYDLSSIQAKVTADGSMVKPMNGQIYTLDLMEGDSVVRYDQTAGEPDGGLLARALAYFG